MSPEQARGKQIDRRTDVWSFGCVLFEMLAGQAAFQGEDVVQILGAVVRGEPDWNVLPPDVSAQVRTVLQRCLQKDPNGDPIQIVDSVFYDSSSGGRAIFSASDNGTLIYRPQAVVSRTQIKWFDRLGKEITSLGQPDFYTNPRLSPDGHRLALQK